MTIKDLYGAWTNFRIADEITLRVPFFDHVENEIKTGTEHINRCDDCWSSRKDLENFILENYGNDEVNCFTGDLFKVEIVLKVK